MPVNHYSDQDPDIPALPGRDFEILAGQGGHEQTPWFPQDAVNTRQNMPPEDPYGLMLED